MSLVKTEKTAPITSGSFRARMERRQAQFTASAERCLLLDVSSSMGQQDDSSGKSRMDYLKEIVANFQAEQKFCFHSSCTKEEPSYPQGSTNLALAFDCVKAAGIKHVILVTDGEPDNAELAEEAAEGLKVDCFYVGPDNNDRAKDFLRKLSEGHSGQYGNVSISQVAELTAGIAGLLEGK